MPAVPHSRTSYLAGALPSHSSRLPAVLVTLPMQPEIERLSFYFKAEILPNKTAALRGSSGSGFRAWARCSGQLQPWPKKIVPAAVMPTVFDAEVPAEGHGSCCLPLPAAPSGADAGNAQSPGDHHTGAARKK